MEWMSIVTCILFLILLISIPLRIVRYRRLKKELEVMHKKHEGIIAHAEEKLKELEVIHGK